MAVIDDPDYASDAFAQEGKRKITEKGPRSVLAHQENLAAGEVIASTTVEAFSTKGRITDRGWNVLVISSVSCKLTLMSMDSSFIGADRTSI
ncbi:hypothetical protein V6N11_046396 [Hibiscus sabdariffa]|uniref:Uncharacterized protein n=1 Tax=Hibiscus sabdariffa TaxID=183260 RepID=A0ABR2P245_9ROSI